MKGFGLFLVLCFHVTQAELLFWEQDEWTATAVPKHRLNLETACEEQRKKLDLSTQLPFMQAASCIAYGVTFPKTTIYDDQKL